MNSQKSFINIINFITLSILLSVTVLAQHQHNSDTSKTDMTKMNCCKTMNGSNHEMKSDDKMHGMHHEMKTDSMSKNSIVREGEINLAAIDENKDGKVYQCPMCVDQIADNPGECPKCGMNLKEVTVEKAKENLAKNGFKVK